MFNHQVIQEYLTPKVVPQRVSLKISNPDLQGLQVTVACSDNQQNLTSIFLSIISIYRVRTGPGKPGKSWNFIMAFSRTGKSWKKATGPGKSWKFVTLG